MLHDHEADKKKIFDWMYKYCYGFKNAKSLDEIMLAFKPFGFNERYFRRIYSELKKEGALCSTSNPKGPRWAPKLHTVGLSPEEKAEELNAYKISLLDSRSRAMCLLEGLQKQIDSIQSQIDALTYQPELITR